MVRYVRTLLVDNLLLIRLRGSHVCDCVANGRHNRVCYEEHKGCTADKAQAMRVKIAASEPSSAPSGITPRKNSPKQPETCIRVSSGAIAVLFHIAGIFSSGSCSSRGSRRCNLDIFCQTLVHIACRLLNRGILRRREAEELV